jgi:hypothetical protein
MNTTAHNILLAARDNANATLELACAEVTAHRAVDCQDWRGERSWFRFVDGSVICVEGSSADERSGAEFDEVSRAYVGADAEAWIAARLAVPA